MKGYAKIRLAVFLCIMMVLPSIVSVLPMTATETSAAQKVTLDWYYEFHRLDGAPVQIEKGAKFYVGDYAYIIQGDESLCASMYSKAKYTSSSKSIATVNSKGLVTAKKTGNVTITIKYKGKTISQKFTIVPKGTWEKTDAVKGFSKALKKVSSSIPKSITKSNALKYTKIRNNYSDAVEKYGKEIQITGFLMEEVKEEYFSYTTPSDKLAVPTAGRYNYLCSLLYEYGSKYNPTATRGSKMMKISSVSANTKEITIKLKNAITADHILAANVQNSYYNDKPNKKTAIVYIDVCDMTTQENYTGLATIKKGSKTVKIKLIKYGWVNDVWTKTSQKPEKGHKYRIGYKKLSWGGGKTVTVK